MLYIQTMTSTPGMAFLIIGCIAAAALAFAIRRANKQDEKRLQAQRETKVSTVHPMG